MRPPYLTLGYLRSTMFTWPGRHSDAAADNAEQADDHDGDDDDSLAAGRVCVRARYLNRHRLNLHLQTYLSSRRH